ncbi:MAG: hypothetical protein QGI18_04000 [Candidatus Marinimicrobia bacterium]|jgi:hypothetical protein|nr:hypothetical protein [Candidatus Neomarinimicrobiota bacterium]
MSAKRDIAMQGRLNMDSFFNRLHALKDNQLRTTMAGGSVPSGFAPKGVVAPKFENPDTMAETREERAFIMESAEKVRQNVAQRKMMLKVPILLFIGYLVFK